MFRTFFKQCRKCGRYAKSLKLWDHHWSTRHSRYQKVELKQGELPDQYFWRTEKSSSVDANMLRKFEISEPLEVNEDEIGLRMIKFITS